MKLHHFFILIVFLLSVFEVDKPEADAQQKKSTESYSARVLRGKKIEPNRAGLRQYFDSLKTTDELKRRTKKLFTQLSDKKYSVRIQAFNELQKIPRIPAELLATALKSTDPETRYRAQALQRKNERDFGPVQNAVCQLIGELKLDGFSQELIGIIENSNNDYTRNLAQKSIVKSSSVTDLEVLRQAFTHQDHYVRVAAIRAMGRLDARRHREIFNRGLTDESEAVRLYSAEALANLGERKSLKALLRLLDSEQLLIRYQADYILRQLTQQDFKFRPYSSADVRQPQVKLWADWIAEHGESAKLNFPIVVKERRSHLDEGHVLLAYGHRNMVREYDGAGKVIFEYRTKHVWSAEKLPSGNILVSDYSKNRVAELNMNNEVVWEFPCKGCLNARPLANGNILAISHLDRKIMEVTRDKKVVFEIKTKGLACDAHRLPNGNTLISEDALVRIVDPKGKNVWTYGARHPYGVEPLPNGNILIADITLHHVIEVTPDKKVVWKFKASAPGDAYRLPNGNTLITDTHRFVEVTPDKKIVWEMKGNYYGSARK